MKITEVRVKMVAESSERLRAFCSVTLDDAFVVRDLKVIDGDDGPFVAMPSRKLSDRCTRCGEKNHLRSKFCNECGQRLNPGRAPRGPDGRVKLYADVAHPINVECREALQAAIIEAYREELADFDSSGGARQIDTDDDDTDDDDFSAEDSGFEDLVAELRASADDRGRGETPKSQPVAGREEHTISNQSPDEGLGADRSHTAPPDSGDVSAPDSQQPVDDDFTAGLDWENASTPAKKKARPDHSEPVDTTGERAKPDRKAGRKDEPMEAAVVAAAPESAPVDDRPADNGFAAGIL